MAAVGVKERRSASSIGGRFPAVEGLDLAGLRPMEVTIVTGALLDRRPWAHPERLRRR
jgi:hypothetical protein